jgi:hypothetical protein
MVRDNTQKLKAIKLRKAGNSYNEILRVVPVAKSTLSLWLRDVGLSKAQEQVFTEKRRLAQQRGAAQRKANRENDTIEIFSESLKEVGDLTVRERLLIGTALYWAEGAKEKIHRVSVPLDFANSDPDMIAFHMRWLYENLAVPKTDITMRLHLHQGHIERLDEITRYWLKVTGLNKTNVMKPIIKKHNPKTVRKNSKETYKGLVAIRVRHSTMLNRRVMGWIKAIATAR